MHTFTTADLDSLHVDFVLSASRTFKSFDILHNTMELARKESSECAKALDVYMAERSFLMPFVRGTYEFMSDNVPRDAAVFYFGRLCGKTTRRLHVQGGELQNALLFPDVAVPRHADSTEFRKVPSMIFSIHCRGPRKYWLKVPGELAQTKRVNVYSNATKSEVDASDTDEKGYFWYELENNLTIVVRLPVFDGWFSDRKKAGIRFTVMRPEVSGPVALGSTPDTLLLRNGKPYRKMVALCVGVNKFAEGASTGGLQPLKCAKNDAEAMKNAFDLLGCDHAATLCDEEATAEDIVKKMECLANEQFKDTPESIDGDRARNLFVFYFSGHGVTVRTHDGPQVVLCAHDYNDEKLMPRGVISRDMLSQVVARIDARHVLFIFDCCHAGGLLVSKGNNDDDEEAGGLDDLLIRGRVAEVLHRALSARAVRVMAGSAAAEKAKHIDGQKHSVFTDALLRAMCCSEKCDERKHDTGCAFFSASASAPVRFLFDSQILSKASANIDLVGGQHPVVHSPVVFGGAEDRLYGQVVLPHRLSVVKEASSSASSDQSAASAANSVPAKEDENGSPPKKRQKTESN